MRKAILFASARQDGNTAQVLKRWRALYPEDVLIDLNQHYIKDFDYQSETGDDDFLRVIDALLQVDQWVWMTPVYWYSMSARHKLFLDRLSDLLMSETARGRQLRGKFMSAVATSASAALPNCFTEIFERTADYLGMHWCGALHIAFRSERPDEAAITDAILGFSESIESPPCVKRA